jgi:predicted AlkP superfamily pyrophosphatase or phosphodiesterase
MYSSADYTITPRPMYPADGRKIPDVWTNPPELRHQLGGLGQFPLFEFWGPATSIRSTEWIARAAMRVYDKLNPTLTLIYLPHLDYAFQRYGPNDPRVAKDLADLDRVIAELLTFFRGEDDPRVIVLSEYGIVPVSKPIHLNRVLREHQMLTIRQELGRELLDAGASVAFAVADHQIAHIYVNDRARIARVRELIEKTPGVARVFDESNRHEIGLDHPRSGELIALAEPDAWFTYYYWLDDARAPDFARTVDIHRKPGYDPVELFIDPQIGMPNMKIGWTLLKRKLGFRSLLNVIGLDASIVRGSHGLAPRSRDEGPVLIADSNLVKTDQLDAKDVSNVLLESLTTQ